MAPVGVSNNWRAPWEAPGDKENTDSWLYPKALEQPLARSRPSIVLVRGKRAWEWVSELQAPLGWAGFGI